ncbi:MAG: hypothetical protein PUE91_00395 [Clostridiales bacterium]|nr:hypothetical protein [Clostridiales bacterium]
MTKALFKKQMMEVFSWVYQDKKAGKNRSARGIAGYVLLYLVIFGFLGGVFYIVADMLCEPLVTVDLGWLYFAIMGLIALFMGVFGSVFNTYASLYQAKDNDLLLSMPIPSGTILMVRLAGVYVMGLMYELIVMIPTVMAWFFAADVQLAAGICTLLIPLVLSVLVLVFSAVLGWIVALISSRLKHKNIMVVILSLIFIAAYYYCYGHAYQILQHILANPQAAGERARSMLYPLYHMGLAAEGHMLSMLIFTAMVGVLFGIVYVVLSRSFLKIATTNRGTARVKDKAHPMKAHTVSQALLFKEYRRFVGSANYMLNCGLGIVVMLVSAGALLWKAEQIREMMSAMFLGYTELLPLVAAGAICLLAAMNDITAPSVSLEGRNLWLIQVLPVSGKQVLMAKLQLHLLLTLVPAAVLTAAVEWVLQPGWAFAIAIPVVVVLYVLVMAAFGLFVNLHMPNLHWTSEIIPIKQSMGVMISLFGGWVAVVVLAGLYYLLAGILSPLAYLLCTAVLLMVLAVILLSWLQTRGARMLETL